VEGYNKAVRLDTDQDSVIHAVDINFCYVIKGYVNTIRAIWFIVTYPQRPRAWRCGHRGGYGEGCRFLGLRFERCINGVMCSDVLESIAGYRPYRFPIN